MALGIAGMRDLDKPTAAAHLVDRGTSGVAHAGSETAGQLLDDLCHRPLEGNPSLNSFRYQLAGVAFALLEIPVLGTLLHRAERSHPAVTLVRPALKKFDLSRSFFGSRQQPAHHNRVCSCGDGFCDIPGKADSAVGNHRDRKILER